jgi:hypothetical protein
VDLDERNLARGELLEFVRSQERVAHGHAPVEVDEGVEAEAHDGRVRFARPRRAPHELEGNACEAPAAGQADDDAGLSEARGLVGEEAPGFVGGQRDPGGVPLFEAPGDGP